MSILQLNPTIPLVTPMGTGQAILVLDYGSEHHLIWTVIIDDTGEVWSFPNPKVRAQKNITMDRKAPSPFYKVDSFKVSSFPETPLCNM